MNEFDWLHNLGANDHLPKHGKLFEYKLLESIKIEKEVDIWQNIMWSNSLGLKQNYLLSTIYLLIHL